MKERVFTGPEVPRHWSSKRKVLDKLLQFSTPFIFALRCFCGKTTYVLKGSTKLFHLFTFLFVSFLGLWGWDQLQGHSFP